MPHAWKGLRCSSQALAAGAFSDCGRALRFCCAPDQYLARSHGVGAAPLQRLALTDCREPPSLLLFDHRIPLRRTSHHVCDAWLLRDRRAPSRDLSIVKAVENAQGECNKLPVPGLYNQRLSADEA